MRTFFPHEIEDIMRCAWNEQSGRASRAMTSASIFVGVDIGKGFHCAAAINTRGNVLLKPVKVLASAEGFAAFEAHLRQLGEKISLLIGLLERDWQVQVFNPVLSSKNARTHLRGRKTDADDALFIRPHCA